MRIDKTIFDKPSGDVRGTICLFCKVGPRGKELRIGHAYVLVGKPPDVTLKAPPGNLSLDDVKTISDGLAKFHEEVRNA